ncbi:hypothetical protein L195_g057003, partial [Trifolium pratense]
MANVAAMATTNNTTTTTNRWNMSSLRSALPSIPPTSASSLRFTAFPRRYSTTKTLRISRTKPNSLLNSFTGILPPTSFFAPSSS